MSVILIKAAQLFLSLSILIVLHELGHFIPAKAFKTRVEKFYLFFDPWFSLFKYKKGETSFVIENKFSLTLFFYFKSFLFSSRKNQKGIRKMKGVMNLTFLILSQFSFFVFFV